MQKMKMFGLILAVLLCMGTATSTSKREEIYIPAVIHENVETITIAKKLQAAIDPGSGIYETKNEIISDIITPPIAFSALGFTWNEYLPERTTASILVRYKQNGEWSSWSFIQRDIDHKEEEEEELHSDGVQSAFLPINPATAYQYKVLLLGAGTETPIVKNLKITLVNAKDAPGAVVKKTAVVAEITQNMIPSQRVNIISRSQWSADENLRVYRGDLPEPPVYKIDSEYQDKYSDELQITKKITTNEKGEMLSWPQEYPAKITKIIVHHTASTANLSDPKKALRDIYYWHTKGRGWGDVGYNYIIDPSGNIYEGRAGGEMVIGAHAGKANTGSIGISVMGNFETGVVSDASMIALTRLISEKTKIHGIDPVGKSVFRGQIMPNVIGHRDVMSTSCPGKNLYDKLPLIAQLARSSVVTTIEESTFRKQKLRGYNFEDVSGLLFVDLDPEQTKNLAITIRNTGTVTWGSETSVVVNDFESIKDFIQVQTPPGRLTFPMQSPRSIAPGDTATFQVAIAGGFRSSLKTLKIVPMINGKTKLMKRIEISVQTTPAQFTYDVVSTSQAPGVIKAGTPFTYVVDLKNTGNINWQNKGNKNVRIGTEKPRDRKTPFLAVPGSRAGFLQQDIVRPGEVGHFVFNLVAPKVSGIYEERFAPVVEGVTWMADKNIIFKTFVYEKEFAATPVSMSQIDAISSSTQVATVKLRNIGGTTWNAANAPQFRKTGTSRLKVIGSSLQDVQVAPGEVGAFAVQISVPPAFRSGKIKLDAYAENKKITTKTATIKARKVTSFIPVSSSATPVTTPSIPSVPSKGSDVRVFLSYVGTPVISGSGSFTVKSGSYTASFSKDTKVTVNVQDASSYIITANNFFQAVSGPVRFVPDYGTILRVDNWERRPSWDKTINDNEFRGILEVRADGAMPIVINELPIEDYLKGLGETLNGDPMEKKKAIVIAARNYVLYYSTVGKGTKFPGKPYDVDDNPEHSQKYVGYGLEKRSPNSVKSVEETTGIIIRYQGNVVRAPYFSSDTGRTKSAAEVWGWKNADFLVSVDDPYCAGMQPAGHGVGMSGCGSLGMAKNGKSYQDILHYYYQNVTIEKAY